MLTVAIEGIDGSGKTTLLAAIGERLEYHGISVRSTRLVSHTIALLKDVVDSSTGIPGSYQDLLSDTARSEFYAVEAYVRYIQLRNEVGLDIALFDRWFPIVDVDLGNKVAWGLEDSLPQLARRCIPKPDLVIWLMVSLELAASRLRHREDWMASKYPMGTLVEVLRVLAKKHTLRWESRDNVVKLDGGQTTEELCGIAVKRITDVLLVNTENRGLKTEIGKCE